MRPGRSPADPWGRDVRRNLSSPRWCGGPALITRPRATDRDLINPPATWTPSTAPADLTERRRAEGVDRFGGRTHAVQESLGHLGCCCGARALGRVVLASVRWARGAPRVQPGRTTSPGAVQIGEAPLRRWCRRSSPTAAWCGGDVAPIFLPRERGVVVAFGLRWRKTRGSGQPIDLPKRRFVALLSPRSRGVGGSVVSWGSKWGSPGEHRAARIGHESSLLRISERNKASKSPRRCRRTTGGQGLAVTRGPLLGRETLWRASIGGKARRRSQACVAGARQPDEPQGRMRDATSPRTCWWRKPSRPGGTARAERARRREASGRSGRKLVGVDSSRAVDGEEVFEKP